MKYSKLVFTDEKMRKAGFATEIFKFACGSFSDIYIRNVYNKYQNDRRQGIAERRIKHTVLGISKFIQKILSNGGSCVKQCFCKRYFVTIVCFCSASIKCL